MRVRRSPYLYVERDEGEQVHVRERLAGNRAVLNRKTLALLDRLREPAVVPAGNREVARMVELGFLVEEGRETRVLEAKLLSRVAPPMFGCGPWRKGEPADFVLVGVPCDSGNRTAPGARYGPDALRQASAAYRSAPSGGEASPAGWVDHETGATILAGARLRDAGEVFLSPAAGAEESSQRITAAVAEVAASGVPVIVGGDHSITFAALRGAAPAGCGLLHLDAHSDASWHLPGLPHDYGNVVSRILRELAVPRVVHAGVRGLGHGALEQPPRRRAASAGWLRSHPVEDFVALLDPGLSWYVSLDIDVLDPAFAPGTATPAPGGLTVPELKRLLRGVTRERRVVGFDLVEVNPHFDHGRITAAVACELLLTVLGGIWDRRR